MSENANRWRVSPEKHETPEGRFIVIEDGNGDTVAMLPEGRGDDAALMAAAVEMRDALAALFRECVMIHRYGGSANNQPQSDAAIDAARAALRKAGAR